MASNSASPLLIPNPKARLFDQVREVMRFYHYSLRTEKAYLQWIRRFLLFHRGRQAQVLHQGSAQALAGREGGWRHPKEMGAAEVREFLTHLAANQDVAASTQNQALNALVFLYGQVLQRGNSKHTWSG